MKICCAATEMPLRAHAAGICFFRNGLKARIRRVRFERLLFAAKVLCRHAAPILPQRNKCCMSARHNPNLGIMHALVCKRRVVALRIHKRFERGHLDVISVDAIVCRALASLDPSSGIGEEGFGTFIALVRIFGPGSYRVVVRRQAFDLVDIEDCVSTRCPIRAGRRRATGPIPTCSEV